MDFKIYSSGSKGNCVVINDVMVDCGIAFNQIKDALYDVKYLIITHIHRDHLKISTLNTIRKLFPRIIVIGNYEVHEACGVDVIANAGFEVVTEDYHFLPFECDHDVLTYGYVWAFKDQSIIYCTDTGSMEAAPDQKYDYFFLESNHDEKKIEAVRDEWKGTYNAFLSAKRHLSTQEAKAFYYLHRRSPKSELIELHKSHRYY